jgi:hypothetical protein
VGSTPTARTKQRRWTAFLEDVVVTTGALAEVIEDLAAFPYAADQGQRLRRSPDAEFQTRRKTFARIVQRDPIQE